MKELTQEIFIGQPIEVDFACVDFDGLLHFGKAINPRYTWASERWHGFDKIGEAVENSGYKPLTSIRLNPIELKTTQEQNRISEDREYFEAQNYYCRNCLAMFEEECCCNDNQ